MTPDELLNDFEKLLSSGNNYDVIIKAGKNENIRSFYTHSLILSSRSTYFKAALSKNWARKKYGIVVFNKPNINPKIMELILKYIYTGTIELDKQKGLDILKYLVASDEICFGNLHNYIESYIIEKQEKFLNEDPTEVLQTILHYESLTSIKNFYLHATRDGFETTKFHELCDDKGPTLIVAKVKDTGSSPIIARCDDYDSIFTDYPSFINLFNLTIKDPGKESFINVDLMEDYEVFKITKLNKSVNREKIVKSKIDSMM
ncbi:unnamed protein product [Rhizophagus irregularis]|nr:unnamed protein product [Rhizophagus irregularis]